MSQSLGDKTEFVNITGTTDDDLLIGTIFNDVIDGLSGSDRLEGTEGDDVLNGGDGNDSEFRNLRDLNGIIYSAVIAGLWGCPPVHSRAA